MKKILTLGFVTVFTVACSQEAKEDLGLVNVAPDEFSVITRAPLSVPPDFNIRPPRPGASRPMEISTRDSARQTIFGVEDVDQSGTARVSSDEVDGFLGKIGAGEADPNIRDVVDAERLQGVEDSRSTAERLLFLSSDSEDQGTPIDPKEELDRLQEEGVIIKKRNEEIESP